MFHKVIYWIKKNRFIFFTIPFLLGLILAITYFFHENTTLSRAISEVNNEKFTLNKNFDQINIELANLKNVDQYKRNEALQDEISSIEATYKETVDVYEDIVKLKEQTNKIDTIDNLYADILTLLSERNYSSATALLNTIKIEIQKKQNELASSFSIPQNAKSSNTPPGSGYSQQVVNTDQGNFLIDIIAADLNSTRVIVDTASDGDCKNDCPVMSLGDFASRSGAFAGINGPYFCPAAYPSCADKKNAFDTLIMNKNKTYFNSDNNVYSVVPAVIFSGNSARFVSQSLQWGRDTSVDAVIASQPALVLDGNIVFGGDEEVKRVGRGSRSFIGASDNIAYIGVVYNANVAEVAIVLKTLGIKNALNLDSGGSTALWSSGRYLVGPGRNTPFGILFVKK